MCNKGQCNTNSSVISRELEGLEGAVLEESGLTQSDLQKLIQLLFYLLRTRSPRCSCCGQTCPTEAGEAIGRSLVEEVGLQSCEVQKLKQLLLFFIRMLFSNYTSVFNSTASTPQ
ncbi:hypothetical protein TSMEX_002051 [Taenia solium]|eukprot:TsM_000203300 transcript=TsM_000203300 gene=TsM_000203300